MPLLVPDAILPVLDEQWVMHLSTVREHSVPLFFAHCPRGLVWISDPNTEHSVDLATSPIAAASIAPSAPPLHTFAGVQLRGQVDFDADQDPLRTVYLARFPKAAAMVNAATTHRFYLLRPDWIRLMTRKNHVIERQEWPHMLADLPSGD